MMGLTTNERYTSKPQGTKQDHTIKIMNSGIKDDPKFIITAPNSMN